MLVLGECGRVIAPVALLGHLPATAMLERRRQRTAELLEALAKGERARRLPARLAARRPR